MTKRLLAYQLLQAFLIGSLTVTWCLAAEGECLVSEKTLLEVKDQKAALRARTEALDQKEKEIATRETALQEEIKRLKELRDEILLQKAQNDQKLEEQVSKLMETLEKMSPKKAAEVLTRLPNRLAVAALTRIPNPKLSKIVANMDAARSSELAELMATKLPGNISDQARAPAGEGKAKRD